MERDARSNAERYRFSDFTWENYRMLLRLARKSYAFQDYANLDRAARFVLWRHDVDFSVPGALKMARLEADEGERATYFLLLHSPYYNLLEGGTREAVREIVRLGHRIALHFEHGYYHIADREALSQRLTYEKAILEDTFGQPIRAFSFHMPTQASSLFRDCEYAGLLNAGAEFFHAEVGFCSDSNGYWRTRRLEDVLSLAEDQRLQVLTHPVWWQDRPMPPADRLARCIVDRASSMKDWYERVARESGREIIGWE